MPAYEHIETRFGRFVDRMQSRLMTPEASSARDWRLEGADLVADEIFRMAAILRAQVHSIRDRSGSVSDGIPTMAADIAILCMKVSDLMEKNRPPDPPIKR